jgi:hypothetical protein
MDIFCGKAGITQFIISINILICYEIFSRIQTQILIFAGPVVLPQQTVNFKL